MKTVLLCLVASAVLLPFAATAYVANAAPVLAQLEPDVDKALGAIGRAFGGESVNLMVAAPAIVFLLVLVARRFVLPRLRGGVVDWLASKMGGLALAFVSALALAFLDLGLSGAQLSAGIALSVALKTLWGFLGGMGIQSGQKTVSEVMTPAEIVAATQKH